jgi:sortase family protein
MFIIGLCLVLYPSIADYWNQRVQSRAIVDYEAALKNMSKEDYSAYFAEADDYNARLRAIKFPFMYFDQVEGYNDILNVSGTGIIGYLDIEKIGVQLPIYHGTSKSVLNSASGHLEGSSLPCGGESTHSAISAHRGLPSAKLFTDLDKLEIGDTFVITVLDRVLTYEVDQVLRVLPNEVDSLYVTPGEDHCTLITCTPYGINTHRLLVRGTRIETVTEKPPIYVSNEAYRIDPIIVTPAVALPMLVILLIFLLIKYRDKPEDNKTESDTGKN